MRGEAQPPGGREASVRPPAIGRTGPMSSSQELPFALSEDDDAILQPPATSAPTIVGACSNAPAGIGKHVDRIRIGSCLDAGVELLSKPYRREQLAAKVRRVLDSAAGEPRKAAETERVLQSSACDFVPAEPFAKSIVGLILRLGCAPSPGCSSAQPIGYRSPKIVS